MQKRMIYTLRGGDSGQILVLFNRERWRAIILTRQLCDEFVMAGGDRARFVGVVGQIVVGAHTGAWLCGVVRRHAVLRHGADALCFVARRSVAQCEEQHERQQPHHEQHCQHDQHHSRARHTLCVVVNHRLFVNIGFCIPPTTQLFVDFH